MCTLVHRTMNPHYCFHALEKNKSLQSKLSKFFSYTCLGDTLFWSAGKEEPAGRDFFSSYYYRRPADIEMTGYALMSYLRYENFVGDALKIVKWLSKQRNSFGGFSSTQVGFFKSSTISTDMAQAVSTLFHVNPVP